ncbi:hypothetical protein NFI96_030450 [Prochilodus magdalenae]|nr:hypothetical protein NFI96_030450 [Prochilodus magdalenae]
MMRVTDIFKAANIDEEVLKTLSREDLKDLFPGPENFLKRKKLWDMIGPKDGDPDQDRGSGNVSATCAVLTSQPPTSTPVHEITAKTVKLPDPPEYVVYTDSELDMVRSQYFDLLRNGKEKVCKMSKELSCRLIRNTITSMVAILRASPLGKEERYPSKHELRAMSQKIVDYYPMLRDTSDLPYLTIYSKMYKRVQNMKSPRKRQGPKPQRGSAKRSLFETSTEEEGTASSSASTASTVILPESDVSNDDLSPGNTAFGIVCFYFVQHQDSLKMQARHYKTLFNMYSKPNSKPNPSDVAQILDLEFDARRAFIDSSVLKEEDRIAKIFEAYPCFKDPQNAMDELRRILGGTNPKYIDETKKKWENFCANVQFYGVWKKVLKPPIPLNMHDVMPLPADFTIAILTGLPSLFPSPTSPPKRLGNPSEALLHVLQAREDPSLYLEKRPLTSPVLLFDGKVCILAVGNVPVSTIPKEEFFDGMLMLMAYYYTMHLTYPKCVATLLSVIQTEVLCDAIHDRDATGSYKRAMAEWKSFIEK